MKSSVQELSAFIKQIWQQFNADGCMQSAAALTLMSLFGVVPLMAVSYAIFATIPAFQGVGEQIQHLVFEHFVPTSGVEVQQYLTQFSQQARKLTAVGILFLAVTAYLMLKNIEAVFNKIWHIKEHRTGLNGFLLYWAVLSLGPLLVGTGMLISTYLLSLKVFDNVAKDFDLASSFGATLLSILPFLLTSATFTLIYMAVPNCKVPFKNAIIGGLITAIGFELAKQLFAIAMRYTSYQFVYGTFAAIPLFFLWLQLLWILLLAGAELVHTLSNYESRILSRYSDLIIMLALLEKLWQKHQHGNELKEAEILLEPWLFDRHRLNQQRWESLRNIAMQNKLIYKTSSDCYVLGKDLQQLTLWQLINIVQQQPSANDLLSKASAQSMPDWLKLIEDRLNESEKCHKQLLALSLEEIFARQTESP